MIRAARPGDLPGLMTLYRGFASHDPEYGAAAAAPQWAATLSHPGLTVIVADQAGLLAATCLLAIIPNLTWSGRSWAVIENVVTHPDHRRQGLGHAVLAHAVGLARAADCYKVTLATGSTQEGTLRFYETAGFTRKGKTTFEQRFPVL